MNPVHYGTCDLYEAAYLMFCGMELVSITRVEKTRCSFLFMQPPQGKRIMECVNEWRNYQTIVFSPRAYAEKRDELKRLIAMQPVNGQ